MGKDASTEDLLALVAADPEEVEELNNVDWWVTKCNIQHGTTRIRTYHVYYTYKQWAGKEAVGPWTFARAFKKHFVQKRTNQGSYYELNPSSFDLSPETYYKLRLLVRRERIKRGLFKPQEEKKKPS